MLTTKEIRNTLAQWYEAWNAHDLDKVMDLFHEDAIFENWTGGKAQGKPGIHGSRIMAVSASLRKTPSSMKAIKKFFSSGPWTGLQARKDTGESLREGVV
jgi:uncharacterized protein (TIGR02246 family)